VGIIRSIKTLLVSVSVLTVLVCLLSTGNSNVTASSTENARASSGTDDYVGSETCQACHEEQFNAYSHTSHARLTTLSSWKGKVTGCESCHGPGKAHVDGSGDKTKIISLPLATFKQEWSQRGQLQRVSHHGQR
jgi:cytochrome c553